MSSALPEFQHSQADITESLVSGLGADQATAAVIRRIHQATGVHTRSLAMPIEDYRAVTSFTTANALFVEKALPLATSAALEALSEAGLRPEDVDYLFFTTVTGVGAPSLDVLLAQSIGARSDMKRVPSFGLGCAGGAAGLARVADYLRGDPGAVGLVVSVELCSLTIQWDDLSMANIVGTGLFGDGAGAAVIVGTEHPSSPKLTVLASRSALYPNSQDSIGWMIGSTGFRLMLTPAVPELIDGHLAADVDELLNLAGIERSDVGAWLVHPGGPRILEAVSETLQLEAGALSVSWEVMAEVGNLSSSTILHVLDRAGAAPSGTKGVIMAVGPGVSVELLLVEWS